MQCFEFEENCDAFYEAIITGEWSGYFSILVVIIIIAVNFFPHFHVKHLIKNSVFIHNSVG